MILYVERHGETVYNRQGRYAGSTDVPLNEEGVQLAEEFLRSRLSTTTSKTISLS